MQNRGVSKGMSDVESIRRFQYRHSRHKANFSVEFIVGGQTFHGFCKDVSDAGIRAEFDGSVVVGSSGFLILRKPSGELRLEAQVTYLEKRQVGLNFLLKTISEHGTLIEFIAPYPR